MDSHHRGGVVAWNCPKCGKVNRAPDRHGQAQVPGWRFVDRCWACATDAELMRAPDGVMTVSIVLHSGDDRGGK